MPRIEKMFAFVAQEGGNPSDEGVVAAQLVRGQWMPLVGADMARVEDLVRLARDIAKSRHRAIEVLEFSVRRRVLSIDVNGVVEREP